MGLPCFKKPRPQLPAPSTLGFEEAMKLYYKEKILPVEKRHDFHHFGGPAPPLDDAEFNAKPSVLLLGQYSVGKTTAIHYLLQSDYAGSRIGPEPTTDIFVVITKGDKNKVVLGNVLIAEESFPFKSLQIFGNPFLSKLIGSVNTSPLLEHLILIDTPGILSGEKQRLSRGYDFEAVVRFLANKVDRIILLFDTSKLDISDEFKLVIMRLKGNEEKVKILLNKADSIEPDELIRVRGALMYNLGRILPMPEIPRVFIGSFWNEPVKTQNKQMKEAFNKDYKALLQDFRELPKSVKIRKINDLVKRAKQVKTHALLMDELIRQNSFVCASGNSGRKAAGDLRKLDRVYKELQVRYRINEGDCPDKEEFQKLAACSEADRWHRVKKDDLKALDEFIERDTAAILQALPEDEKRLVDVGALRSSLREEIGVPPPLADCVPQKVPAAILPASPPPPPGFVDDVHQEHLENKETEDQEDPTQDSDSQKSQNN